MTKGDVNKEDLGWLVHTSATDINFKKTLERASTETIQAALAEIEGQAGHKVREKALSAQLAKLRKPTLAEIYAKQGNLDSVSEAALETVEMERLQEVNARNEQADRERRIAECHEVIGRVQGVQMLVKFGDVASLVWLKDVKEQKIYRDLPNVGTWDKFCERLGKSRRQVDEDLQNLEAFGEDFLATVAGFRVGYRDLRKLRQLTSDGTVAIEDEVVIIGDESIPLDPDHREDLQAALERVIEAKDEVLREKDAVIRSNEKLLQSKQELIRRQEKDLARYEDTAARKGLTADEDAFIQKCTNARVTIDGFFMDFDPERNPLPEDASPRMKAALMETLRYFKRVTHAAYDTAGDLYGDAEMDSPGWIQPNLRVVDGEE